MRLLYQHLPCYLLACLELLLVERDAGAGDVSIGIICKFWKPKVRPWLLRILTLHEIYDYITSVLTKSLILCRLLPLGDILGNLVFSQLFILLQLFLTYWFSEFILVYIWRIGQESAQIVFRSYWWWWDPVIRWISARMHTTMIFYHDIWLSPNHCQWL